MKLTFFVYAVMLLIVVMLAKVDAEARELEGGADRPSWVDPSY